MLFLKKISKNKKKINKGNNLNIDGAYIILHHWRGVVLRF
jgi:hypothetical protein